MKVTFENKTVVLAEENRVTVTVANGLFEGSTRKDLLNFIGEAGVYRGAFARVLTIDGEPVGDLSPETEGFLSRLEAALNPGCKVLEAVQKIALPFQVSVMAPSDHQFEMGEVLAYRDDPPIDRCWLRMDRLE
jgi:hypothetical protein